MTPELTIRVPCPTCGGTGLIPVPVEKWTRAGQLIVATDASNCPDCTDGTIRQEVSCKTCKWNDEGECMNLCVATTEWNFYVSIDPDFGCKKWEAE